MGFILEGNDGVHLGTEWTGFRLEGSDEVHLGKEGWGSVWKGVMKSSLEGSNQIQLGGSALICRYGIKSSVVITYVQVSLHQQNQKNFRGHKVYISNLFKK